MKDNFFSNLFKDSNDDLSQEVYEDDFGYSEVLKQREENRSKLRQQLYKLYLTDKEIDKLFKIIIKTEQKMDKIKSSVDYKNCVAGEVIAMQHKMLEAQKEMKETFDKELKKVIQHKYELAKKIVKENKNK